MKNFNTIRRTLLVIAFALTFGSCKDDFTEPTSLTGKSIAATMATDANFNLWTAVLKKVGLYESLNNNNSGVFTIFAPSDPAMTAYLAGINWGGGILLPLPITEASLLAFMDNLTTTSTTTSPTLAAFVATVAPVVNYHIVSSKITANLITGNQTFATLQGSRLSISRNGSAVMLNGNSGASGANVTSFDLLGSNGVAHTIDKVMAVIGTAGAPGTFASVLAALGYTSTATVLPVSYTTNPPTINGGTTTDGSTANFNLFAAAIRVTGQAPILFPNVNPLPDFTVFAPTDLVFIAYLTSIDAALNTEVACYNYIASLISATPPTTPNPTLAQLTTLVQYHSVPGRFLTTDFTNGQVMTPLTTSPTFTVVISPAPPSPGPYTFTLTDVGVGTDPVISGPNTHTNAGILHTINQVLRSN